MKTISFSTPKNFTPPEGINEGDSFDFMVTGYFKGPKMFITGVEGTDVSGEDKAEGETEPKTEIPNQEMGMVDAVEKGMAKPGMA
jgi:hypothetical protein